MLNGRYLPPHTSLEGPTRDYKCGRAITLSGSFIWLDDATTGWRINGRRMANRITGRCVQRMTIVLHQRACRLLEEGEC